MTVKKRLSRSNTLMIILPVVISLLLAWVLMNLFFFGLGVESPYSSDKTYDRLVQQMQELNDTWTDENSLEAITRDIMAFELYSPDSTISISVYKDGVLQHALGDVMGLSAADSDTDGSHALNQEIYVQNSGDYTIYLQKTRQPIEDRSMDQTIVLFWPIVLIMVILVVFVVNRLLTRYVFRYIVNPLNTLVEGVHELRDGNLDYRIEYTGQDEFSAVCHDFNDMAQQLSDLIKARQQDDENRRELIAGISHDLRTPLTSIKAYVEGLQKGVANTPGLQAEYLAIINAKADDLEHIVQQLFQYSKLDTGAFPFKMENIDMGQELAQYVRMASDEYEHQGLLVSLGENVRDTIVMVDPVQLRAIFTNILENAVKYGAETDKRMLVQCQREAGQVHLRFWDNGPGVEEAALDKLFNAFYRNDASRKNPGQGSGLGLAISRKVIDRFGGTITAENAAGGGLCIHITLPVVGGDIS